jgi:hypothetical protein
MQLITMKRRPLHLLHQPIEGIKNRLLIANLSSDAAGGRRHCGRLVAQQILDRHRFGLREGETISSRDDQLPIDTAIQHVGRTFQPGHLLSRQAERAVGFSGRATVCAVLRSPRWILFE